MCKPSVWLMASCYIRTDTDLATHLARNPTLARPAEHPPSALRVPAEHPPFDRIEYLHHRSCEMCTRRPHGSRSTQRTIVVSELVLLKFSSNLIESSANESRILNPEIHDSDHFSFDCRAFEPDGQDPEWLRTSTISG